jgi:hypothetical protein
LSAERYFKNISVHERNDEVENGFTYSLELTLGIFAQCLKSWLRAIDIQSYKQWMEKELLSISADVYHVIISMNIFKCVWALPSISFADNNKSISFILWGMDSEHKNETRFTTHKFIWKKIFICILVFTVAEKI